MKRGVKAEAPGTKLARGTYKPGEDGHRIEVISPDALPMEPDWLTRGGSAIWLDEIGRVAPGKLATEQDSTMFGNYCCLQGAIVDAWRAGEVPPAAHLMEARKMAEQFGLFGRKSRVISGVQPGAPAANPFARNGRRA